jgi:hypothetical protein
MPTASDLVTDLPADFETFGQAVATSMADLLGGTTGQILAKASNTDMDFTWVTNDVGDITGVTAGTGLSGGGTSGAVTLSIDTAVTADLTTAQTLTNKTLTSPALTTPTISTLTTNGDLLYGTGSGAIARQGIGTTGQVLTVSGGVPTWSTPAAVGGKVLQVVQAQTTTSTSISTTTLTDTTITATITPTSATSKILVMVDANAFADQTTQTVFTGWALLRGSTNIYNRSNEGGPAITALGVTKVELNANSQMIYLDSPATTSATTYKVQAKTVSGTVVYQRVSNPSTITLLEIGA